MFQHARRLFLVLGLAFSTALGTAAPAAQAQIPYFQNLLAASQTKYAAMVVDARSGEVLYAKHADSPRYPASITKVMTLYLTFEALASGKLRREDRVVCSPPAASLADKVVIAWMASETLPESPGRMPSFVGDWAVAWGEKTTRSSSRSLPAARASKVR